MAKLTTGSIAIDHTSDAGYRVWVAAFLNALDNVNPAILTRTSDTGQVNTSTITRPSTGTPDYAVYKFDDGIGAPLFLRFSFGTGNATTAPGMVFLIGTGTNGAGTLSGQLHAISGVWSGSNVAQLGPALACVVPGHFSFMFGQGAFVTGTVGFGVAFSRSSDANGNPTGEGVHGMIKQNSNSSFSFFTSDIAGTLRLNTSQETQVSLGQVYARNTTAAGGVVKPMPVMYMTPDVRVATGLISIDQTDVAMNAELQVAQVGSTPRNYKVLGFCSTQKAYLTIWE